MPDQYLTVNILTGREQLVTATVNGGTSGQAGDIVSLDNNGKLSSTVMPSTSGSEYTLTATSDENLAEGDWVQVYRAAGVYRVRKSLSTITGDRLTNGFVTAAVAQNAEGTAYLSGVNDKVPLSLFTEADVGKTSVYSSFITAGSLFKLPLSGVHLTIPGGGYILHRVGLLIGRTASYNIVRLDIETPVDILPA